MYNNAVIFRCPVTFFNCTSGGGIGNGNIGGGIGGGNIGGGIGGGMIDSGFGMGGLGGSMIGGGMMRLFSVCNDFYGNLRLH